VIAPDGKVSLCVLDERWPFVYLQVYADAVIDRDRDLAVDVMMASPAGCRASRSVRGPPYIGAAVCRGGPGRAALPPYGTFASPPPTCKQRQLEELTHWYRARSLARGEQTPP